MAQYELRHPGNFEVSSSATATEHVAWREDTHRYVLSHNFKRWSCVDWAMIHRSQSQLPLEEGDATVKEATFDDARALAEKLNLNKDLVWKIIKGKKYSNITEMAMAVQESFAIPASPRR